MMVNINPYQQYQQNAVASAGKGELTLMLYNGAVKFINLGIKCISEKNIEEAHKAILRAQDIILYLNSTLDMQYELSNSLASLYDYINRKLMEANMKKDDEILGEALSFVEQLRDTWTEMLKGAKSAMASGQ